MKYEERVTSDAINVTDLKLLSNLPKILEFENGAPVLTKEDFAKRRLELYKYAVEFQYGTTPPAPQVFKVDPLYITGYGKANVYRITAGTKEKTVSFRLKLMLPKKEHLKEGKLPVIVDGDMCFCYAMNQEYLNAALENGIAWALFDRTEIVPDYKYAKRADGPLYSAYPDLDFGAIMAWAWGYSRVVDALEIIGLTDPDCIAFSGHSRGGKTALLAGAIDQRAAIVNPNESGAGGSGCYRVHMKGSYMGQEEKRSEELGDLVNNFPHWLGTKTHDFIDRESDLPFDQHYLKALVAPRILFISEAAGDVWTNPVGTYLTNQAAKSAFDLLGAGENLLWYWRHGPHYHEIIDVQTLAGVINHKKYGTPLPERMFDVPFDPEILEN